MTTRTENTITYSQTFNVENRLSSVTTPGQQVTQFYYDGDGVRVKKEEQNLSVKNAPVITTLYLGALEIQITASTRITKTYYSAGAQMIAMREVTSTANVTGTLSYLHSDHLGSTSLVTSITGSVVSRQSYYAYGGLRTQSGATPTDIGFTAQRNDGMGLMDFRAREYSVWLGQTQLPAQQIAHR